MSTNDDTDSVDLLEAHDFAVAIGLKAGAYLRRQSAARSGLVKDSEDGKDVHLTASIKMSSVDIVTEADFEVCRYFGKTTSSVSDPRTGTQA